MWKHKITSAPCFGAFAGITQELDVTEGVCVESTVLTGLAGAATVTLLASEQKLWIGRCRC